MNENGKPALPGSRADVTWERIGRRSESGSFIEDQLADLVDEAPSGGGFRVDVVQIPPEGRRGHG